MKYRAIIKQEKGWWIGWLVDFPGVNAQERSREEVIESLKIAAREMRTLKVDLPKNAQLETIEA
jgi:predicted RNase H-like HicB family nuclease